MTQICGKWLKNMGKWLNYLTNSLKIWKMTQRFGKWPKYLELAEIHGTRLNCLRNGFTMLEMA